MDSYQEALKYLNSFIPQDQSKWNTNWGLDKISFFLEKLGNPHHNMKYVHVTGTSGKGSTCTMIASILQSSGYKTGLHVSPHILDVRERAQINGQPISKKRFIELLNHLETAIQQTKDQFGYSPSYYEILLAIAFLYFQEEKCDIVVLEVGLGGKLDGTNVIQSHHQVITNIGLDHMAILGPTKEHILRDKQEIIKPNSFVVSGITEPNLQDILNTKVSQTLSHISYLQKDFQTSNIHPVFLQQIPQGSTFDFVTNNEHISDITISLPGEFQIKNASIAIQVALNLKSEFVSITHESIKKGLYDAQIQGRFQIISNSPLIIIDGAHNPDKIKAFIHSIKTYFPNKKFVSIFRYKKRSDIMQSIGEVASVSQNMIICGSNRIGDMGFDSIFDDNDIKNIVLQNTTLEYEKSAIKALQRAKELVQEAPHLGIIATGSIYMLDDILNSESSAPNS